MLLLLPIMWSGSVFLAHATWNRDVSASVFFAVRAAAVLRSSCRKKVCYHTFVSESVPLPPLPTSRQGDSASMLSGEGCPVPLGLDAPQLHTRVSVGQLRSTLLQQAGSGAQPEKLYDLLHVCDPDWHYRPVYPLWPYLSAPQHLLPALFVWTLAARTPPPLWIWPWSRAPRGAGDAPGATSPAGQAPGARTASASGRSRSRPMKWRRAAGRGCVLWSGCRLCGGCTGLFFSPNRMLWVAVVLLQCFGLECLVHLGWGVAGEAPFT